MSATQNEIALVVNTRAKVAREKRGFIRALENKMKGRGPIFVTDRIIDLKNALSDIQRLRPKVLAISGGDGTLRQVLTQLISFWKDEPLPDIAVLKGGTMNTIAASLSIHRSAGRQLQRILDHLKENLPLKTERRNLLQVNRYLGFIFAVGGFSRFIEIYENDGPPTRSRAFRLTSSVILSSLFTRKLSSDVFRKFKAHLWKDDRPLLTGTDVTTISASTTKHIGFNFKPFYGANGNSGNFGLLIFRGQPRRLILHLPKIYFGRPIRDRKIIQLPAGKVSIQLEEPELMMMDGDILGKSKDISISIGPSLNMVTG